MPKEKKPVDEDRARRRAALEQKRAARRAAKEQATAAEAAAVSTNTTTCSSAAAAHNKSKAQPTKPCLLLQLDASLLGRVYTYLPAVALARTMLTCKTLHKAVGPAKNWILQSRLGSDFDDKFATRDITTDSSIFPSYLAFIEETVCCSNHSNSNSNTNSLPLPAHAQGRMVSCSPEHSLARVGDGGFAAWGVGKRGQLGHGQRRDERIPRRGTLGGLRIVQVAAGGGLVRVAHSLLLTSTGQVWSFGTGQYGALGHGYSAAKQLPDCLRPRRIAALESVRTVCVAAGELHSAVVTEDGDVYSWGDGFCGQLGHGDKRPQVVPLQVTAGGLEDECVANITCGSRHTLAVTEDGDCYSWGLGHFGVLGRRYTPFEYDADAAVVALATAADNDDDDDEQDTTTDAAARLAAVRIDVDRPAPPPPPMNAAEELRAHLDLIANLSLEDSSDQCIPKVIDSLQGLVKLVGASAGHRHSLFLDDRGGLYASGAGRCGCLGLGDAQSQMFPCRIPSFDDDNVKIRQMSAGVDMSMAVSTSGVVYAWGKTDAGRIGLGLDHAHITQPRRVTTAAASSPAVDVECGYVHSLIVGLDGKLQTCGHVGVEGEADGQQVENKGMPRMLEDVTIWRRVAEPVNNNGPAVKKERWKKYGKYEVKGRSKMMD